MKRATPKGINPATKKPSKPKAPAKIGRMAAPEKVAARKPPCDVSLIDGEKVFKLAVMGRNTEQIAKFFDCSVDTIQRHFKEKLDEGWAMWVFRTEREIHNMSGWGATLKEMAAVLNVSTTIIERYFADALLSGQDRLQATIKENQVKIMKATGTPGAAQMAIWMGKQHLNQKDPDRIRIDNTVNAPLANGDGATATVEDKRAAFDQDGYAKLWNAEVGRVSQEAKESTADADETPEK